VAVKLFGCIFMLLVAAIWVAASTAGSKMGLSNAVTATAGVAMAILTWVVGSTIGWSQIRKNAMAIPLLKSLAEISESDWVKAFMLWACWPMLLIYVPMSVLNQSARRAFDCTKPLEMDERNNWLTQVVGKQIQDVYQWKWTSILVKVMYISIGMVMVSVGIGKVVTLFLSWLNDSLASFSLGVVSIIFVIVGLVMFLLPPVPGVPVYISCGIIITKVAWKPMGFWQAICYASVLSFLIKIPLAFTMQMKCIGEQFSDNLWVKKSVGVNSITIKAIQKILKTPGMDIRKVCILCGGPDWFVCLLIVCFKIPRAVYNTALHIPPTCRPTSVLCGILKLDCVEMLKGSCPVIFLTAPCCFAGGFLLQVQRFRTHCTQ
jgi:hypothetical protein